MTGRLLWSAAQSEHCWQGNTHPLLPESKGGIIFTVRTRRERFAFLRKMVFPAGLMYLEAAGPDR